VNTVDVKATKCSTCIFRPGNPMHLQPGRVRDMVESCGDDGFVICHQTLSDDADEPDDDTGTRPMVAGEAICRGYLDAGHYPQLVQVAERLGLLREVP
jgi:hypothetical protein